MSVTPSRQALSLVLDVALQGVALAVLYGFALRVLGAESVGVWAIVMSVAVAGRVADLGLSRGLVRFVPLAEGRPDRVIELVDAAAVGTLVMMAPTVLIAALALWFGLPLFLSENLDLAYQLVPWTIVLLVLSAFGQVYLNVLTSVYRSDLRAFAGIAGTIAMLVACLSLVQPFGIVGLLWAQCIQQIVTLLVGVGFYRARVPGSRLFPRRVMPSDLKTLFLFGWQLQIAGIAMLLFEPAARLIMGVVGSIESVAYFDMASRLLQQVRNLIVTANQTMTPYFSKLSATDSKDLFDIYGRANRVTTMLTLPLLGAVVGAGDLLSVLWIGEHQPVFTLFLLILGVGWGMNSLSAPAYFLANGSGHLSVVVISHVIVSFGSSVLAVCLGAIYGGVGVAAGVALGLAVGSVYCMRRINQKVFALRKTFLGMDFLYVGLCVFFSLLGPLVWRVMSQSREPAIAGIISAACSLLPLLTIAVWTMWKWKQGQSHPIQDS